MKIAKPLLAVVLATTGLAAHAATVSDITTAEADLVFAQNITLTHTLSPVSGLEAKAYAVGAAFAHGTVSASAGTPTLVVAATPNATQTITGDSIEVKGTNDATDVLKISLAKDDGTALTGAADASGRKWYTLAADGKYTVANADATAVAADTYHVTIDAGIWTA